PRGAGHAGVALGRGVVTGRVLLPPARASRRRRDGSACFAAERPGATARRRRSADPGPGDESRAAHPRRARPLASHAAQLAKRPRARRMTRVMLCCPYSLTAVGGAQSQVLVLAHALRAQGVDSRIVAPCDGPPPEPGVVSVGPSTRF